MKFLKSLFGASAEKYEDKADELRLDFEYRDAAYYYRQALDALEAGQTDSAERLRRKLRDVRRKAFAQLIEEATEFIRREAPELAHERLETAANFVDDEEAEAELARRREDVFEILGERAPPEAVEEAPESVAGTEDDLLELALGHYEPADRERAMELGEPFRLAYEACQREQWTDAGVALEGLLETHPEEPIVLELAGMAAESAGNDDDAMALYSRAYEVAPGRPDTIQGLVSLHRKAERIAEARNLLSKAVSTESVHSNLSEPWVRIHLDYAVMLSEDGHHNEAASTIIALTGVRNADRGNLFYNLAGVLEKAGRDEDALTALKQAIEASPRQPVYMERLADFLVARRAELDVALKLLVGANQMETTGAAGMLGGAASKAVKSPNRARYLYKMGRIYFLQGDDREAERIVTTALAISRDPEVTAALERLRSELKAEQPAD